ncbi:MAG: hypothetical protein OHK0021_21760 [Bryobacter sp.]
MRKSSAYQNYISPYSAKFWKIQSSVSCRIKVTADSFETG